MTNEPPSEAPNASSDANANVIAKPDRLPEAARASTARSTAWQSFLAAVQFLTRIPVPAHWLTSVAVGADPADTGTRPTLARTATYFPLVGTLIGLSTGLVIWLTAHLWPLGVAVILGLAFEALLTGALHEDALADFCDAFGGGWTREDVLRILEDSRIGSFGALGLLIGVLLRAGALASMERGHVIAALMASATLGRWAALWAMAALPPLAGRRSLAEDADQQMQTEQVMAGAALAIPGLIPLAWNHPGSLALAIAGVVLIAVGFTAYVRRRIGGITGDCLGCLCYLGQVWVLLACLLG